MTQRRLQSATPQLQSAVCHICSSTECNCKRRMIALTIILIWSLVAEPCLTLLGSASPSQITERIELTETDLFETKNWDSSQVDVVGFHLGMTRQEAKINARRNGFKLLIPDLRGSATCSGEKCEVCDANVICPGIMLDFSGDDHVIGVEILKIPDYGAEVVKKAAITNRFKGKTRLLFDRYSNHLRLELLGKEGSQESPTDKNPLYQRMVTYNTNTRVWALRYLFLETRMGRRGHRTSS